MSERGGLGLYFHVRGGAGEMEVVGGGGLGGGWDGGVGGVQYVNKQQQSVRLLLINSLTFQPSLA